jgi:hypothetical protein
MLSQKSKKSEWLSKKSEWLSKKSEWLSKKRQMQGAQLSRNEAYRGTPQ